MTATTTTPISWGSAEHRVALLAALTEIFPDSNVPEEMAKIPEIARVDFSERSADGGADKNLRWEVGQNAPGSDNLVVFAIFDGEAIPTADVMVYVYPTGGAFAEPGHAKLWRRYTISRIGAATRLEVMNRATFIEEVAEDYAALLETEEPEPAAAAQPTA